MKYVRTARGYQNLKLEDTTVTGTPQKVSNELADQLVAAGEQHGVEVIVYDSEDDAQAAARSTLTSVTPDLSAGVAAVTGTGDPVQTPGTTPEGDEPSQAGAQEARGRGRGRTTTTTTTQE